MHVDPPVRSVSYKSLGEVNLSVVCVLQYHKYVTYRGADRIREGRKTVGKIFGSIFKKKAK